MNSSDSSWETFRKVIASGDEVLVYEPWRIIGYPFFVLALKTKTSGNHLTFLAFCFSLLGAAALLKPDYIFRLIGSILIQIGLGIDTVDGAVARYKQTPSDKGAWLSRIFVITKTIIIWFCVTISIYIEINESIVLIYGLMIISHFFLANSLMDIQHYLKSYRFKTGAFKISKHRLGLENSISFILLIFVITNQMHILPIFMAYAGFVPWIILFYRGLKN